MNKAVFATSISECLAVILCFSCESESNSKQITEYYRC